MLLCGDKRQCPTILGVAPLTPVAAIKHALQGLTGIPMAQQLLSSVGCVIHDEFLVNDYDGLSTLLSGFHSQSLQIRQVYTPLFFVHRA